MDRETCEGSVVGDAPTPDASLAPCDDLATTQHRRPRGALEYHLADHGSSPHLRRLRWACAARFRKGQYIAPLGMQDTPCVPFAH